MLNSDQNSRQINGILSHLTANAEKTQIRFTAQECMVEDVNHLLLIINDLVFIHPLVYLPCINAITACKPQAYCCFQAPFLSSVYP